MPVKELIDNIGFRIARNEEDHKGATQVRIRVFVDIQKFPLEEEIDELDKIATHVVAVSRSNDSTSAGQETVVGTLRIINSNEYAKIGRVVMIPEYQGKGLGKKMMEFSESYIATSDEFKDVKFVKLGSQCSKKQFYSKCGYQDRGEIYDELGVDHIWMYKSIADIPNASE